MIEDPFFQIKTVVFIRTHADCDAVDRDAFGGQLMKLLRRYYDSVDLDRFGGMAFSLWESLFPFQDEMPFAALALADDPDAWKDRESVRSAYEAMLSYYE